MAKIQLAPDKQPPPVDRRLEEAAGTAALNGKPIKLRIQPDFYDQDLGKYLAWSGLSWVLDLEDVAEGRRLRLAMTALFNRFGEGAAAQEAVIAWLERGEVGAGS